MSHICVFDLLVEQCDIASAEVEEVGAEGEGTDGPLSAEASDGGGRNAHFCTQGFDASGDGTVIDQVRGCFVTGSVALNEENFCTIVFGYLATKHSERSRVGD